MKGENRRVMKFAYLAPRTSTYPIDMAEYLDRQQRDLLIHHDSLNPEFVAWYERMRKLPRYKEVGKVEISHR
jgi:hypothetical protein